MHKLMIGLRVLVASLLFAGVAMAQETAPKPEDWQTTITAQIDAFRTQDAETAFSLAAKPFHQSFSDPAIFFMTIISSGYVPIATSKSHSFGAFKVMEDGTVGQVVHFVDADQKLYDAVYALSLEEGGWRVEGVQLMKVEGMGV